jgi:hypothetical protein
MSIHVKAVPVVNGMGQVDRPNSVTHLSSYNARTSGMRFGPGTRLTVAVGAFAILGDRDSCAALYPAMRAMADNGVRRDYAMGMGPLTPSLAMSIAADAAGEWDLARTHFEETLRFEDAHASRLYQPPVRFWFGRHLLTRPDADSRARGAALPGEAAEAFGALGMVIHKAHAERQLRSAGV